MRKRCESGVPATPVHRVQSVYLQRRAAARPPSLLSLPRRRRVQAFFTCVVMLHNNVRKSQVVARVGVVPRGVVAQKVGEA